MKYRLLPHHNSKYLREIVYDVYELTTSEAGSTYSTAPNGIIGISIITNGQSNILINGKWHAIPSVSVYGLVKKPDIIKMSANFREIAIGFTPYFLQLLVKDSMSNIVGAGNIDASHLFKELDMQILRERISLSTTDAEILDVLEQFILKQLNTSKSNDRLLAAMNLVYREGVTNVKEIGEKINLSSTSVRNLFREGVGRPPKEVITVLRINRILKSSPEKFSTLTEQCYEYGYFDQAHFIHDFSKIMGMTPSRYFKDKNLAFDFYNFGRWQGNIFDQK